MKRQSITLFFILFSLFISFAQRSANTAFAQQSANIVFIGNSITYGALHQQRELTAPPVKCAQWLSAQEGIDTVYFSNCGRSGRTTYHFLPRAEDVVPAGDKTYFGDVVAKTRELVKAHPTLPLLFSIMLGTNDAVERKNNAHTEPENYVKNLTTIIDSLLQLWPDAHVVLNRPIYNTSNYLTKNGSVASKKSLKIMNTYYELLPKVVGNCKAGHVHLGDADAYGYFEKSWKADVFEEKDARGRSYWLHPNEQGAAKLAEYWGKALLPVLRSLPIARRFTVNLTPDGKANMVAYLPEKPTGRAIVDCPGGGYSHLSMQNEGHDWAQWFNDQGIAYFVLTYRMPGGDRTIPMGDAWQAIRTVRDSAAAWHVNPLDVGIMGFSAGGHLASTVSTHSEYDCRPNFSILFYPVISMNERETHKGSCVNFLGAEGQKDEQLVKSFSNHNAVRSHLTPPAIILTATDDRAVPVLTNSLPYYTAMHRAGNSCSLYIYPSGGHGFGFRGTWAFHDQMLGDLAAWLRQLPSPHRDAVRVACIGNSITHGSGIDMQEQRAYPAQLQQLLGSGYYVKNYGVGGRCMMNTSDHPYMQEQAWRDAKAFQPNIVVIKLGTNDSKDFQWNQQQYERDYQAMLDTLQSLPTKPTIYLCTPVRAFRDKWGITDSVIVNGVIPTIQKVAKRNKLQVIDLHPVITDAHDMTSDMIHPNDKGAAKMAKTIAEAIRKD